MNFVDIFNLLLILFFSVGSFFFLTKYFSNIINDILLYHEREGFWVRIMKVGKVYLMIGFFLAILIYFALNLEFMGKFLFSISSFNKIVVSIVAAVTLPLTMRFLALLDIYHSKKIKRQCPLRKREHLIEYRERIGSFFFSFFLSFILLFLIIFICMLFVEKTDTLFDLGKITSSEIKNLYPLLLLPWIMALISEFILILVGVPVELKE
jgi:hypothetical protein